MEHFATTDLTMKMILFVRVIDHIFLGFICILNPQKMWSNAKKRLL